MFSKLLLVLGVAFAYGTNLTLKTANKVSHTPNYSIRYDFIDYEYPAYRLGDYDITELVHISAGGGQVRYFRVRAIIPRVVFDTLAEYENVFIYMPLYGYNSAVPLIMRIDWYKDGEYFESAMDDLGNIPLSMSMLKVFPYTVVDLPNDFNVFDPNNWDSSYQTELRLTFYVPYTKYMQPPGDYAQQLRNITLFTERGDGSYESYAAGYTDGLQDGYENGYETGFADAESVADGSWLGSLVFGTVGGIVGFLFALSDFEVLGVSIMSIITLFVAVGIIKLLIKVIK
jgi:hypothetical protein